MKEIEFVSYDGKYPNLCSGTLKLKIDGKEHTFLYCLNSGGAVYSDEDWNWRVEQGEWTFDPQISIIDHGKSKSEDFNFTPEEIGLINDLVNENVEQGCCGGCI